MASSEMRTVGSVARAATTASAESSSSSSHSSATARQSSCHLAAIATPSTRCAEVSGSSADNTIANRSRTCSRTSPSSGLNVAKTRGAHACAAEVPSRSTLFSPAATTAKMRLATASSIRLSSSRYSTPLCARARSPGEKTGAPRRTDSSTSTLPATASSVAAKGTVTKVGRRAWRFHSGSSAAAARMRARGDARGGLPTPAARRRAFASAATRSRRPVSHSEGRSGSALATLEGTTSCGGRSACVALTSTVLHVPRRPWIATPPTLGSTAASASAALMASWFTTRDMGNAGRAGVVTAERRGRSTAADGGLPTARTTRGRDLRARVGILDPCAGGAATVKRMLARRRARRCALVAPEKTHTKGTRVGRHTSARRRIFERRIWTDARAD